MEESKREKIEIKTDEDLKRLETVIEQMYSDAMKRLKQVNELKIFYDEGLMLINEIIKILTDEAKKGHITIDKYKTLKLAQLSEKITQGVADFNDEVKRQEMEGA